MRQTKNDDYRERGPSMWRNSEESYGLVAIGLHWLVALVVIAMFALGLYMVGLGYYDPWYHRAPALHKSIGLLLAGLFLLRLVWRALDVTPRPLGRRTSERRIARLVHWLLYILLAVTLFAGYLIASADGRPVAVFGWFDIPALLLPMEGSLLQKLSFDKQEDFAGAVHAIAAWALVILAALHGLAAFKHHFIDRDATLKRMLWPRSPRAHLGK